MEDGLVPDLGEALVENTEVLILVVVEDGLVHLEAVCSLRERGRLNPCCSGRWSRTIVFILLSLLLQSLNPCCSGRWSRTLTH